MSRLRVPPGRAGRQWLRRRLGIAEHGADVLDRKLRVLGAERTRLAALAAETERTWAARMGQAREWLQREELSGGQRELHRAEPAAAAEVEFAWATVMGIRRPTEATTLAPPMSDPGRVFGSAAAVHTAAAFGQALEAAARHAAASTALQLVDEEAAVTRNRIRALRRHWIPRLHAELARIELELEEREQAAAIWHRRAASRQ